MPPWWALGPNYGTDTILRKAFIMARADVQVDVTTCKLHMTSWIYGSFDSLPEWDKGVWQNKHFLKAVNEALWNLLTFKNVPIEKLQNSKCHWEDLYDEDHGTDIGYTNMQVMMPISHGHKFGSAYNAIIIYQCLISLSLISAEYLLLLYASCCCFCQAVAESYAKQVIKLMNSEGSSSFTTQLSPRYDPMLPLYVTLTTEISLMAFMKAHQ